MASAIRSIHSDDEIILALISAKTIREAAESVGVGERAIYRKLQNPAFAARLTQAKRRVFDAACDNAMVGFSEAIERLRELKDSEDAKVALAACGHLVDIGNQFIQADKFDKGLEEVREKIARISQVVDDGTIDAELIAAESRPVPDELPELDEDEFGANSTESIS